MESITITITFSNNHGYNHDYNVINKNMYLILRQYPLS